MSAAEETVIARAPSSSPDPTGLYSERPPSMPAPARWLIWLVVWAMIAAVAMTPLDVHSQALFGVTTFVMAWLLARIPGRSVSLALIIISVAVSSRYITWRVTRTIGIAEPLDFALGLTLLAAELYAYVVLLLGYVQGAWPMRRGPVGVTGDPETWPLVDIFIPTYNEPLDVVKAAIIAAKNQDWPQSRLRVYLLDDGRRPEFRAFCEKVGVSYLTRPDNKDAKAGNINHALAKTRGDFVAIFDCDHIPTRSFLQLAMGWFQRDSRMAMVQTPHHFHSPDPFERNLRTFRRIPNEGELFYGMLQRGNDLWNAAFFCGSCAVIRRGPLEEIGGIAPETVTEDAHTMLKLHRRGYSSAYIDIPQASGLATESLSAHIGQRIRWARGMTQIFRIDNPFFGRGLKLTQRLCYAAAMLHFLYGIPRLIFLTAPLAFLLFDAHIFNASAPLIIAYALPHLAHAILTNSRLQGDHRHSFWAEVYESVLAFYLTIPTTLALISPKLGKFNVTAKGGVIQTSYFDLRIAAPYLILLGLNLIGAIYGVMRIVNHDVQLEAVAINLAWTGYNLVMIAAALAVAWETRQRRAAPRVEFKAPAMLWLPDGKVVSVETVDVTLKGAAVRLAAPIDFDKDEIVELAIADGEELPVRAEVVRQRAGLLHLRFIDVELPQEEALVRAIYGRPDAWLAWRAASEDRPLGSLGRILGHGVKSIAKLPRILSSPRVSKGLLLAAAAAALASLGGPARAEGAEPPPSAEPASAGAPEELVPGTPPVVVKPAAPAVTPSPTAGLFDDEGGAAWVPVALEHLGFTQSMRRYATQTTLDLGFFARGDEVLTAARLQFVLDGTRLAAAPVKELQILVNSERVAILDLHAVPDAPDQPYVVAIEPRLLSERNNLEFKLIPDPGQCLALVPEGTWGFLVDGVLETQTKHLTFQDNLALLPLPFFDPQADDIATIRVAFLVPRGPEALHAAGLVGSYFGLIAGERLRFEVTFDGLPDGHGVVIATNAAHDALPGLPLVDGPTIAVMDNPRFGRNERKLLVLTGRDLEDVLTAARFLALAPDKLGEGVSLTVEAAPPIRQRAAYDAPRWSGQAGLVRFDAVAAPAQLRYQGAVGGTISVPFRIAPDVFAWPSESVTLDLYWTSDVPVGVPAPVLKVEVNGEYLATLPPAPSDAPRGRQHLALELPTALLAGFNVIQVHVVPPGTAYCPDIARDLVTVAIDGDSTLHLEGLPHFAQMPDISRFVDDGFPFTRAPDLGATALVLPDEPAPAEVGTMLSVLAHASSVTGVPPTGAVVLPASRLSDALDRDLVVIGASGRVPFLANWDAGLVVRDLATEPRVAEPSLLAKILAFLQGKPLTGELERLAHDLGAPGARALLVGLESPFEAGRSAVIITATSEAAMPDAPALRGFVEARTRRGDVMVVRDGKRAIYQVGPAYDVGVLPPVKRAQWFLANHWILLVPLILLAGLIAAWVGRRRFALVEFERLAETSEGSA